MLLTPGQAADVPQAPLLFAQHFYRFCPVIDKAYDTDAVLAFFTSQGTIPVIPPKANRVLQRDYHRPLYKERNQIECFIGRRFFAGSCGVEYRMYHLSTLNSL